MNRFRDASRDGEDPLVFGEARGSRGATTATKRPRLQMSGARPPPRGPVRERRETTAPRPTTQLGIRTHCDRRGAASSSRKRLAEGGGEPRRTRRGGEVRRGDGRGRKGRRKVPGGSFAVEVSHPLWLPPSPQRLARPLEAPSLPPRPGPLGTSRVSPGGLAPTCPSPPFRTSAPDLPPPSGPSPTPSALPPRSSPTAFTSLLPPPPRSPLPPRFRVPRSRARVDPTAH